MLARSQYICAEDMGFDRVGRDIDVSGVVWSHFLCEVVSVWCQYLDSLIDIMSALLCVIK